MRGIPQFWGGRLIIKNTEFSPRPSVHLLSGREAENCSLKLTKKQMHMDPQWVVSIVIEREVPSTGEQRLTTVREFWRSKCTAGGRDGAGVFCAGLRTCGWISRAHRRLGIVGGICNPR